MGKCWHYPIIWQLSTIFVVFICSWKVCVNKVPVSFWLQAAHHWEGVSNGGEGVALFSQKIGKISAGTLQGARYAFVLGLLQDSLFLWLACRVAAALGDGSAPGPTLRALRPAWITQPSVLGGAVLEDSSQLCLTPGGKTNYKGLRGWGCGLPSSQLWVGAAVCDCCPHCCAVENVKASKEEGVRDI